MKNNLDDLAKIAFDEWQSDMPLEYQMQYVPLFGEGFAAGWDAAINHVDRELKHERLANVEAFLESERAGRATHGYECIGILAVKSIWDAAIASVIARLEKKMEVGYE